MITQPPTLTPSTPVDAALRALKILAKEKALADAPQEEGAPDLRPVWRFLGLLCSQMNQLARQLPPSVREQFTACHLATMFGSAVRGTPMDSPQRSAWRHGYGLLLGLLVQAGVEPKHMIADSVISCSLWACLQQMAWETARTDLRPKVALAGQDPQQEAESMRRRLIELREMLLSDWAEAIMTAASVLLEKMEEEARQQQAATEPTAEESPAP
jgi:hypothetical protein